MKIKSLLLLLAFSTIASAQQFDTLVWADEFNVDGSLDTAKWWHQTKLPLNGQSWYNGEIQHYTDRDTNSRASGGNMILTALKETYTNEGVTKDYTSARLNSKFAFTYGRVEVKAQLPTGVGTWPAIWMLGQNITETGAYWQEQGYGTTGWPACGEIDIMEHWGNNQDHVSSAMHTPSSFGGTVNVGSQYVQGVSTSMHVYALEWTPTKMVFTVDSVEHYTYEPSVRDMNTWPFDDPQYLLFNIAIQATIDTNFTSSPMIVDYVRVYQSSQLSTEELKEASVEVFPNPATNYVEIVQPYEYATAQFTDLLGKVVLTQDALDIRTKIDVSSLTAGTYIARITDAKSGKTVQRIVVVQ
jgi:beta-glucanase (GH16 family)